MVTSRPVTAASPSVVPATDPALRVEALCCVRGDRILFENIGFSLGPGAVVQLEGVNGSGKTTLLRAVCGLAPIETGRVLWCGATLEPGDEDFLAALTYIGHVPGVKLDLTPLENLRMSAALAGLGPARAPHDALDRVGLAAVADTPLRRLSAGQCRRAALARLVVTPTPLWILDEPLTALDAEGKALVEALIDEHAVAGGMTLVSTHQPLALEHTVAHAIRLGD